MSGSADENSAKSFIRFLKNSLPMNASGLLSRFDEQYFLSLVIWLRVVAVKKALKKPGTQKT